jgi:hypothetical protein
MPSTMNGQRMNASLAPTNRMISISLLREKTAIRIVFTIMNTTVRPTRSMADRPARRTTFVTPRSFSYCSWRVVIRSISSRSPSASPTDAAADGSLRSTSMLE